jgi:hypothetical protein
MAPDVHVGPLSGISALFQVSERKHAASGESFARNLGAVEPGVAGTR